jgi:hypothetical protein
MLKEEGMGCVKKPKPRSLAFLILGICAVLGWAYVFLQSDLFCLRAIETNPLKEVRGFDVSKKVFDILDIEIGWRPWQSRHTWFIPRKTLEEKLKEELFAESVSVEGVSKNILRLFIQERSHRLVGYNEEHFIWINLQGEKDADLMRDERREILARIQGQKKPTAYDPPILRMESLEESGASSTMLLAPEEVKRLIELGENAIKAGLLYRYIETPRSSSTLKTLIDDTGRRVLLDTGDLPLIKKGLEGYKALREGSKIPKGTQIIDLRVPGKIFLK